jgi:predicted nucleic acid-binding protein
MLRRTAVVDNDALINLTHLKEFNIFHSLRLLFSQIFIPMEVLREYEVMKLKEPNRIWFLEKLKPDQGFYSLCTKYDSISLAILKTIKDIDAGEAEAVAQHQKLGAHYIISDDRRFKNALSKALPRVKVFSTLHVIAMLELSKFIDNRNKLLQKLHSVSPISKETLITSYRESATELAIRITRDEIYSKNKFSKIGLT